MRSIWLVTLALAMLLPACKDDKTAAGEDPAAAAERRRILTHLGEHVVLQTYLDFEQAAGALEQATATWAEDPTPENRTAAQTAWIAAMDLWQEAEVYQLGPAGQMSLVAGGADLRDAIYSWPLVNTCRVDQETIEEVWKTPETFAIEPINVRGLDALEYLLFVGTDDNTCAPNSTINTDGSWAAQTPEQITARRAGYAATAAVLVRQDVATLLQGWSTDGGNFLGELSTAGEESTVFNTTHAALNSLSDAMFYVEKETKDMKLAIPAGVSVCATTTCPDDVESRFAHRSKAHIQANLRAFRKLLVGGDDAADPGLDDLLMGMGAANVSDDMVAELDAAIAAIDAIPGTLTEALQSDRDAVVNAYNALQAAMMRFKTQYITVLDLDLPQRAEGDND